MGLDMYLSASKYIGCWSHDEEEERQTYRKIAKAIELNGFVCEGSPHLTVNICVAYWRKANAVHKWFVDHCQDGVDECQESSVSHEQLKELRDLCAKVIETKDGSLLPPEDGFFFGSTEIGECYWQDMNETVEQLDRILKHPVLSKMSLVYHASW